MGGCSTVRKIKPRSNSKFVINYFTEKDKEYDICKGYKGIVISLKRAEITKITKEYADKHYKGEFEGQYEIYSRDWNFFGTNKQLKDFKREYS